MNRDDVLLTDEEISRLPQPTDQAVSDFVNNPANTFGDVALKYKQVAAYMILNMKEASEASTRKLLALLNKPCKKHAADGYAGGNNRLRHECPVCMAEIEKIIKEEGNVLQ